MHIFVHTPVLNVRNVLNTLKGYSQNECNHEDRGSSHVSRIFRKVFLLYLHSFFGCSLISLQDNLITVLKSPFINNGWIMIRPGTPCSIYSMVEVRVLKGLYTPLRVSIRWY